MTSTVLVVLVVLVVVVVVDTTAVEAVVQDLSLRLVWRVPAAVVGGRVARWI